MKQDLARQYREAMEEFCSLVTGLSLLGADDAELRDRLRAAEARCSEVRAALFDAASTPSR
jgi:hypothetical protein